MTVATTPSAAQRTAVERAVGAVYDDLSPYLTERSLYVNYGYWREAPPTHDAAAEALAGLLADAAELGPGDEVLDAGFGYGDQDLFWARSLGVCRIVGLDVAPRHVERARARVARAGLSDRVDLRHGSAIETPFEAASFDKVVSLEAALHFVTRADFFREAHRVLRPGGALALTDVIPLPPARTGLARWLNDTVLGVGDNPLISRANLYDRGVYARLLAEAGFEAVEVRSIREHVFAPLVRHLAGRLRRGEVRAPVRLDRALRRLAQPDGRHRLHFFLLHLLPVLYLGNPLTARAAVRLAGSIPWDYVVARGRKPLGSAA
jgi:cyclopropane fatty-acyl-phospholipid synthase-like methyltransferase